MIETTVSPDGTTMSNVIKATPPPGGPPTESTNNFARVAGGPGMFGTWRMSEIEGRLQIEPSGDGVIFRWVDFAEATCRFDGRDCPLEGAVAAGSTMTLRATGPRNFEYQDKTRGKVR